MSPYIAAAARRAALPISVRYIDDRWLIAWRERDGPHTLTAYKARGARLYYAGIAAGMIGDKRASDERSVA